MSRLFLASFTILSLFFVMLNTGCSSMFTKAKDIVGMEEKTPDGMPIVKYSENPNVVDVSNRNYRRMTRQRMEEEAELHSQAGSMWVMEGQGAYLFAQNKSRRDGDLMNIKIDGAAQKQIDAKVSVIRKLLKQLEEEDLKSKGGGDQNMAANGDQKRTPASDAPKAEDKDEGPVQLDPVPSRIVERMPDGSYRIKGQQPFMIGKREYKVIVTGMIRPEDFNDEGISSGKLLDPQYDVVSLRKKERAE